MVEGFKPPHPDPLLKERESPFSLRRRGQGDEVSCHKISHKITKKCHIINDKQNIYINHDRNALWRRNLLLSLHPFLEEKGSF